MLHGAESLKAHASSPQLTKWVLESNHNPLEKATIELENIRQYLNKLSSVLDQIDSFASESDVIFRTFFSF